MTYRIRSKQHWSETERDIGWCFDRWRVRDWEIQKNVMGSRVHSPNLTREERAVSVRFVLRGRTVTISLDSQERPIENLRALYLCLEDMRMLEVRGLAETVQSAYKQLAAPTEERDPYEVLGLRPGASRDEIEGMWRLKARRAHPDVGGSDAEMAALNAARDRLLEMVKT